MASIPDSLFYTAEHEWVRKEGDDLLVFGITDYAQASLGDITFVELPEVGATLGRGDSFGVVESVKAASDLYAPVSGEVVEVNEALESGPDQVNSDPYGEGWLIKVKLSDAAELSELLDPKAYAELT